MTAELSKHQTHSGRAIRATLWAGVNTLIPMLVSVGVLVITSRLLTPKDFGIVALATGVALLGSSFCPSGFGEAIVQRLDLKPVHLDSVFWLCIGCGALMYALECALAHLAAGYFKIAILASLIPVVSLKILFDMAAVVPNALIARSMSFHLFAIRSLIASVAGAALSIGLLLNGYGLWALVVSQLTTSFVTAIVGFTGAGWFPKFTFSVKAIREIAGYGAFSSATANITFLSTQNEQIFVGLFVGTAELGLYNFAKRVITVLNSLVSGSLGSVAHPMFSGIQNDRERVCRGYLLATFVCAVISFPIFIGLAITADRIVPIVFGPHWERAIVLVQIQCLLGLLASIGTLQGGLINSQGKANWWFYYQPVTNLAVLVIIVIFARFGVEILMIALVARAYALWFIPVRCTLTLLSLRTAQYFNNFRAPISGSAAMLLAVLAERGLLPHLGNDLGLVCDIVAGSAAYAACILLLDRKRVLVVAGLFLPKLRLGGARA